MGSAVLYLTMSINIFNFNVQLAFNCEWFNDLPSRSSSSVASTAPYLPHLTTKLSSQYILIYVGNTKWKFSLGKCLIIQKLLNAPCHYLKLFKLASHRNNQAFEQLSWAFNSLKKKIVFTFLIKKSSTFFCYYFFGFNTKAFARIILCSNKMHWNCVLKDIVEPYILSDQFWNLFAQRSRIP